MKQPGSRRQRRYEHRMEKRRKNKEELNKKIGTVEDIFTYSHMYKAGKECCRGVRWKESTQKFELRLFSTTAVSIGKITSGKWRPSGYHKFVLRERGKERAVEAPLIRDRQVEKVFTQYVLYPLYSPSLIYNNGASLRGKGFDFSKRELVKDLHWHYRRYGREGSIILLDFKDFFQSVPREKIRERHKKMILDDRLRVIADKILNSSKGDIGVPLGVEPSQMEMIAFPSPLDNYLKCQLSLKCMGHYMDDYYIIVPPDRDAKEILDISIKKAEDIGLTVNRAKTRIAPLTRPFKYCKAKYTLTETGKVFINGNRKGMIRAKHKIKSFKEKIDQGKMRYMDLWMSINGILNYFGKYNDHNRVLKLRRLFYSIYGFSAENIQNFRLMEVTHGVRSTQAV